MVSPKPIMMSYWKDKDAVVQYVSDQLPHLKPGWRWTMTITAGKSAAYCVRTVIDVSSDDTEENSGVLKFSDEHHNI